MVFSFERPRARVSDSFYRPECRFVEKGFRKTYREATPLKDSSIFERLHREREVRSQARELRECEKSMIRSTRYRSASVPPPVLFHTSAASDAASHIIASSAAVSQAENFDHVPLWRKHPYRLPVEDELVAPHEDSVWPSQRPHFHLVSSYDLMCKFLGIDALQSPLPGGY